MPSAIADKFDAIKVDDLLRSYPGLALKPTADGTIKIAGEFQFRAQYDNCEEICDRYSISIVVGQDFPRSVPTVTELDGRIPPSYHTLSDGTLCLGSRARLMIELCKNPNLPDFVDHVLIPYLYGHSYWERHGRVPQGELPHGRKGLLQDYQSLFSVDSERQCIELFHLASLKKQAANKLPCFCGNGKRLGRCHNRKVNSLRSQLGRRWFSQEYASISK